MKHACNSSRIRQPVCQHFFLTCASIAMVNSRGGEVGRSGNANETLVARGHRAVRRSVSCIFNRRICRLSPRLSQRAGRCLDDHLQRRLRDVRYARGRNRSNVAYGRESAAPIGCSDPHDGLLGPCGRTLDYPALRRREYELQRLSGKHEWRIGCRIPLANKPFRRPCAHARTIPRLCPADILEFPSLHRNAARHL